MITKITLTKNLLSLCNNFTKDTHDFPCSQQVFCDLKREKTTITDGFKLLSIPNNLPIIQENLEAFKTIPSNIINHAFISKYKKLNIGYDIETNNYLAAFDEAFEDCTISFEDTAKYPNVEKLKDIFLPYTIAFDIPIKNTLEHHSTIDYLKTEVANIKDYLAKQKLKKEPVGWNIKAVYVEISSKDGEIIGKTACKQALGCNELFGKEVLYGYIKDCPTFTKRYPLTQLLNTLVALSKLDSAPKATVLLNPASNTAINIMMPNDSEALIMPIKQDY